MKQRITKVNYFIILFTFIVELVLLNIEINSEFSISIYNNIFKWIKINIACIAVDTVFILYMLDFKNNRKAPKNILNIYKLDVNLKIVNYFIWIEILKAVISTFTILQMLINIDDYIKLNGVFALSSFLYYALYLAMPKKDNIAIKLKKLKKSLTMKSTDLNFILIDGDRTPSTFDLSKIQETTTSKNNIYINIKRDLPKIMKCSSANSRQTKEFIEKNTVAIIHEVNSLNDIQKIYSKQEINNFYMYHIFAVKGSVDNIERKQLGHIESIKVCDIKSAIEFSERLFSIRRDEIVKKSQYRKALKCLDTVVQSTKKGKYKLNEVETKNMETIYKYNFNNRLKDRPKPVPNQDFIFELYRNAYLNNSPYQSILIFFNNITVIGKSVEYYLFAKNNPKFSKEKVWSDIIGDNPPIWNNHILLNIYKYPDNILYDNLRNREYKLSPEELVLIKCYLGEILNIEITSNTITFDGLMELFKNFRNKVEAHGIINDANVYAVWNLTRFFANMLNRMFKISEMEYEYSESNSNVKIGYNDEKKVDVGKYITMIENSMCFIKDSKNYINYFSGDIRPSIVSKEDSK